VELRYAQEPEAAEHPKPPYQTNSMMRQEEWDSALNQSLAEDASLAKKEGVQGMLMPLLLLMAGGMFLFFGCLLLFFSQDGELVLRWSQGYWMLYCGLGIPLLFAGWRFLRKLTV
jgi:hypothetical protein